MMTVSEVVATATIWVLTAAGGFFGTRALVRRRRTAEEGRRGENGKAPEA